MVCYMIPLTAALISTIAWRSRRGGPAGWWLNLLLYGGAIFGVVDHLWNGELFLISGNVSMDLLLGATITLGIFGAWGITLGAARIYPEWGHRMGFLSQDKKRLH